MLQSTTGWANDDRCIIFKWLSIELLKVRCFISAQMQSLTPSSIGQKNRLSHLQTHAIGGVLLFKQDNQVGERASILTFRKLYSNFNFCFYLVFFYLVFFPHPFFFFASIRAVISAVNTRPPRALCVRVCVCVCVCVAVRVLRSVAAWGHCITASPTQVST